MSANVVTVVQARLASTRLPGKALLPLAGRPVLEVGIERIRRSSLAGTVVVATTTSPGDDPIVELCGRIGVDVFRGDPTDLLDRHYRAATAFGADAVVKIPSDCPLVDPDVVDAVIGELLGGGLDYVSNLHPPTWPDGSDVEAMSFTALATAWDEAAAPWEREHTTPFLWERPERFRLGNVTSGQDLAMRYRLTLDYPEDLTLLDRLCAELGFEASIAEIVAHLADRPQLGALNSAFLGVNWYRHHLADLRTVSAAETRLAPGELLMGAPG